MCGIVGSIQTDACDIILVEQMTSRLTHRGPDDWGTRILQAKNWSVGLGHTRLAVIDPLAGKQPMSNKSGNLWVTFNGEIYNFQELRTQLTNNGYSFQTNCDTEILLALYELEGLEFLSQLNGIFAFGLWDHCRQKLVLARDRIGTKPLYYSRIKNNGIAFASELSALMIHPQIGIGIDEIALGELFQVDYIQAPRTIIDGVQKLEPAQVLVWEKGKTTLSKYWHLPSPLPDKGNVGKEGLAKQLNQRLGNAVKKALTADVEIRLFLSGGIDSSVLGHFLNEKTGKRPHSFSMGFEDSDYDESSYANLMAHKINSHHHHFVFRNEELVNSVPKVLEALDEPIADPSFLPCYLLAKEAAKTVKVVFGGDGGDELFAGYPTYLAHQLAGHYRKFPKVLKQEIIPSLIKQLPTKFGYQRLDWKLKNFFYNWQDNPKDRHLNWMSSLNPDALQTLGLKSSAILPIGPLSDVQALMNHDLTTYLPGSILTKTDRAGMAHGLEIRPPFLENELLEWCLRLGSAWKIHGLQRKFLLKQVARQYLPPQIIKRSKRGFAIPIARWFQGPLGENIKDIICDSPIWSSTPVKKSTIQTWANLHQQGKIDRSKTLWTILTLDSWLRKLSRNQQQPVHTGDSRPNLQTRLTTGVSSIVKY